MDKRLLIVLNLFNNVNADDFLPFFSEKVGFIWKELRKGKENKKGRKYVLDRDRGLLQRLRIMVYNPTRT